MTHYSYDDDITFTFSGYTGSGTFVPILVLWAGVGEDFLSASASASLGPASIFTAAPSSAGFDYNYTSVPFTFGVPLTLHLHLQSSATAFSTPGNTSQSYGATSYAEFMGLRSITLSNGQTVTDAKVFETSATPEPPSLIFVLAGFAVLRLKHLKYNRL